MAGSRNIRRIGFVWCMAGLALVCPAENVPAVSEGPASVTVKVGESQIIDTPTAIRRVAISSDTAELVVATPREILLNGKKPGESTLAVWLQDGEKKFYNVTVAPQQSPVDAIRREIQEH